MTDNPTGGAPRGGWPFDPVRKDAEEASPLAGSAPAGPAVPRFPGQRAEVPSPSASRPGEPPRSETGPAAAPPSGTPGNRRTLVIGGIVAGVVVVIGVGIWLATSLLGSDEPIVAATRTTV